SCPSRKFPCKHALGLFLLLVPISDAFPSTRPPKLAVQWW
ncbi:MAG: SWIM zinc finger family protein, partial [Cyanobacteria bacterium J06635_15]